jgi:hypothetical protein
MPASDEAFEPVRAAIDELAGADAAELLAEARAHARARVGAALSDAFTDALLERVSEQLAAPAQHRPTAVSHTAVDSTPHRESSGELAWYVYGVVRSEVKTGQLPGVDRLRPTTMLREGALAAVVSQVPLEEFGEEQLREHLADMGWVETIARAHEEVLDQIRAQMTVIPMRMCTVYRTEKRVHEMLRRESEALREAVDHLEGKTEWGVKVFADPRRVGRGATGPGTVDEDAARGAAYMDRKRRQREEQERAIELIDEAVGQIHQRLCSVASDGLVVPPQRPEASGHSGDMILNGVYLVQDAARAKFDQELHELQAQFGELGMELELSGPWPAYNFVPGTIGAAW